MESKENILSYKLFLQQEYANYHLPYDRCPNEGLQRRNLQKDLPVRTIDAAVFKQLEKQQMCSFAFALAVLLHFIRYVCTNQLNHLNKNKDDCNRAKHILNSISLVTITNCNVTKTAATNCTSHCRIAD